MDEDDKTPEVENGDEQSQDQESPEEELPQEEDAQDPVDTGEFTGRDYLRSTTREYQGLAESVAKARKEESVEQSAVGAHVPGLGPSVVGLEDLTGQDEDDPEEIEQIDRARRSELALRILTGLAVVVLVFAALYAGELWITLLLGLLIVVAVAEFYLAVRSVGFTPVALIGLLGAVAVFYAAWISGPYGVARVVAGVVLVSGLWFVAVQRSYPLANLGVTVMGVVWIPVMASFAIPMFRSADGWALTTGLVVFTALNDIAAFAYGRAFGSRKLAPVLSPNKTLEGLLGAAVITVLAGLIIGRFGLLEPLTMFSAICLAAVISVVAPLGDLAESAVKRMIDVKDMGSILPGHGGVLDRLDAFLFTIPATYLVYVWFGYL